MIKLIMKELNPTEGTIIVNGQNLNRMKHRNIAKYRRGLGVVFQDFRLLKDRDVYENVAFAQRVIGVSTRRIKESVPAMLQMVGLSAKYKMFPQQLSGGEQQMLAVGRALMSRPKLIMMDEPSLGLAPIIVKEIFNIIKEINKRGVTILLIEQNANMALHIADLAYVLETGTIALHGTGQELLANEKVKELYLGKGK